MATLTSPPPVLVLPHRECVGLNTCLNNNASVGLLTVKAAKQVFPIAYPTDAHFVQYVPVMPDTGQIGKVYPRLSKRGYAQQELYLHRNNLGLPKLVWICLDFDTPGHTPLVDMPHQGSEWLQEQKRLLKAVSDRYGWVFRPYRTRSGGRAVAYLSTPLDPWDFEIMIREVIGKVRDVGLLVDEIYQWTALFRLPNVTRPVGDIQIPLRASFDVDALVAFDSSPWVGKGDRVLEDSVMSGIGAGSGSIELKALPPLDPSVDVFNLVNWSGIEDLRDKLSWGDSLGDDGARFQATRTAVASVSARMDVPRADAVEKLFAASLLTMRGQGSVGTIRDIPKWIQTVTEQDRIKKELSVRESREFTKAWTEKLAKDRLDQLLHSPGDLLEDLRAYNEGVKLARQLRDLLG